MSELLNFPRLKTAPKNKIRKIYNSQIPLIKTSLGCTDFAYNGWRGGLIFGFPGYKHHKSADGFAIYIHVTHKESKSSYKFEIVTTFTCNWAKDFDNDGFTFDEFHGIKRSFYNDENLLFVLGYTTEKASTWILEIYNNSTGKIVHRKTGIAKKGAQIVGTENEVGKLPLGVYLYNFTLKYGNDKKSKSSKSTNIESF